MREITLGMKGKNKGKYVAMVDDDMFDELNQFRWHRDGYGYVTRSINKLQRVFMARVIMGAPEGMYVDHIDRNPLNNTKGNLRICTAAQNAANRGKRKSKSKYKGVSYVPKQSSKKPYQASIKNNYKQKHLGQFETEEDAARAYDKAALELQGEFANINFPTI